jgi:hypothetical protein
MHVFTLDPYTGAATASSSYSGYGFNARATLSLPFVRGNDTGHHALAFSRRIDVVYDTFSGETASGSSMSVYDVAGGAITGDHSEQLASPLFEYNWLQSGGDSVFLDRGGNALMMTGGRGWNQAIYYMVKPDGSLQTSFLGEITLITGTTPVAGYNPVHGLFVGTLN